MISNIMTQRIVPWVDPITNEPLFEHDNYLIGSISKYKINNGIPNFVNKISDPHQEQVQKGFSFKWAKTTCIEDDNYFNEKLKNFVFEFMGLTEDDLHIFEDKIVLEVGIGSGSSARLWASKAKEFHGMDISEEVHRAKKALQTSVENPILSQADLNFLPYKDDSFDVIVSNGVLHHTPNTKVALQNIIKKLKPGGLCLFYIYKKKSPIREFCDDYIRSKLSNLKPDLALKELESITDFAKSLHEQSLTVEIAKDIPILEIKKGKYDLQLFIYQYFFKCFWNESLGYDNSNIANFDWYYPKFSWRHTKNEIRDWCKEFNLEVHYLKENMSGYSCLVSKNKSKQYKIE